MAFAVGNTNREVPFWGGSEGGFGWMKENKKSGGGDVRAKALSWDGEWDKSRKLIFSFISTLAHGGLLRTPLTSLAARKKSRFAEKKSASPKKNCAYSLQDISCSSTVAVGACNGWSRCREWTQHLVGAQYFAPAHLMRCLIVGYNMAGALRSGRKILRPYI